MNKYEVTYLIDVVSKDPNDYTLKRIVEAENEVGAIKKDAISGISKSSSNIELILNIEGNTKEVMNQLLPFGYCYTDVKLLAQE